MELHQLGSIPTVAPQMAVACQGQARKGCRFIPLADEHAVRTIGVARLKHRLPTLAQRTLIEHLENNSVGVGRA